MNDHDIDRLAAAANAMRPDWPLSSLRTFIRKHMAHRPVRDAAVALAWITCEPNTATPARVLEAGPWWRAAAIEDAITNTPPKAAEQCRDCGRTLTECRSSALDCGKGRVRPEKPAADDVRKAALDDARARIVAARGAEE